MLRCIPSVLPLLGASPRRLGHAVHAFPPRMRSRSTMSHAHADVRVRRALCACSDHLLLLHSSIGAAETLLEAAVHQPRACAAAVCVVGASQALLFAPSDLLRVEPAVGSGGLERVGALCDARVSGRMGVYRCVLDGYGASAARGPVWYRCRARRDVLLHSYAKTRDLAESRAATRL